MRHLLLALALATAARAATVEQLEQRLEANPGSLDARAALAEAYLHECQLERSLDQWQTLLRQAPDHPRAKLVVSRLTAQALDLDTHLATLETLIGRCILDDVGPLLDAAAHRAATASQKARILYLRGALAAKAPDPAAARASFEAAARLYPHDTWAARATIALADAELVADPPAPVEPDAPSKAARPQATAAPKQTGEARRLLRSVIDDADLADNAVKDLARLKLVRVEAAGLSSQEQTAALRALLPAITSADVKRRALDALARQIAAAQGRWVPDAVEALAASLATAPPRREAAALLERLRRIAAGSRDPATLAGLASALDAPVLARPHLARAAAFARVDVLLAQAAAADDPPAMGRFARQAHATLDAIAARPDGGADKAELDRLRGRALLLEAQKLAALDGPLAALPALTRARDHYLAILPSDPSRHLANLARIGDMLEQMREWETAAALYAEAAARFPHTAQGRDALLKVARLHQGPLAAPLGALDVYADYAARYPAELPYRQQHVGRRLERLGFANVLDFQKRNRLKPDGILGPASRRKLEQLEATFDLIRLPKAGGTGALRGVFVHRAMFSIARRLVEAGRDRDAVVAYRLCLNLFPTKREADDALLDIARIFADALLFHEALGAYSELMDDYPNGDKTSEAYVEAAECLENLGQWPRARELYELYLKKFPNYRHVARCKARIPRLEEIEQYQTFIAGNPQSPKVAEAQYQIATILYKEFESHTKAAVEYTKVADKHPRHVRAADALFTAGTAQLRAEHFPAARALFARLAKSYPDTRLADDALYWVGHTHEYAARALGRLAGERVVLRRRELGGRARLRADVTLRRRYHPDAQPGPEVPDEVWGGDTLGVLASGSKRDRVNADLLRAIRAYEQVVARFKTGDMAGRALLRIGTIYTRYLKDPDRGMAAFQQLLDHHPTSKEAVGALFEVGAYHLDKKHYAQAIEVYEKFAHNYRDDPRVEDAMVAIARCHIEQEAWDKALDACRSYLNAFPKGRHAAFVTRQVTWIRMYHF